MSKCPYCNTEVRESDIEVEDGCCPECGAMISAPDLGMGDDEFDEDADLELDLDESPAEEPSDDMDIDSILKEFSDM